MVNGRTDVAANKNKRGRKKLMDESPQDQDQAGEHPKMSSHPSSLNKSSTPTSGATGSPSMSGPNSERMHIVRDENPDSSSSSPVFDSLLERIDPDSIEMERDVQVILNMGVFGKQRHVDQTMREVMKLLVVTGHNVLHATCNGKEIQIPDDVSRP
jgi:hypothetical protein